MNTPNPYKPYLDKLFETITDFKHNTNRLNKVLIKNVETYTKETALYFSATSLVIGDWTGPTENGWKLTFPKGTHKVTLKDNYPQEVERVLSREFGLAFAQCYEAFETFLKDIIVIHLQDNFQNVEQLFKGKAFNRHELKGGEYVFNLVKRLGGQRFKDFSNNNNHNFRFKAVFKIFSEIRHAVTHSQGVMKRSKIPDDKYYTQLFMLFLPMNDLENEDVYLKFNYKIITKLLMYLSEFGFQIFKIVSEEQEYDWKLFDNMR